METTKPMTKKAAKESDKQDAIKAIRDYVKPGDTLYTDVTHVSKSGMSRSIRVFVMRDNSPWDITHFVRRIEGSTFDEKHGGVKVGGCGMDMGFALVYSLSRALFRDGFLCTNDDKCPANDHNNERGEDHKKGYFEGRKHSDPGYAIRQRWL